ncbi:hypothetical protein G7Y79_00047g083310 [Physcia stellaris]|nr:hypothetical protein G7Y79_00047g083310 [Physcia stellaris]
MSLSFLVRGGGGRDDKDRDLPELQRRYSSLLKASDESKIEHDRAIASKIQDMRDLSVLRERDMAQQERITVLEKELQACKDDLFRVQPIGHLPDSTITRRFGDLDDLICVWIDGEISLFMDEWQPKTPGAEPKLFHHNGHSDMKAFLRRYPEMGGEYVVRFTVHYVLQKDLFGDEIWLFGLATYDMDLLKLIEQGMAELDPPREPATIRAWRSETLAALAKTSRFPAAVGKGKIILTNRIYDALCKVFPIISGRQSSLETLYHKIITPAVELAITMQTSATSYRFEPRLSRNSLFKRVAVPKTHLGHYRMIDAATGKTLKLDSPITPNKDGDIGDEIMVVTPGLLRRDAEKMVPLMPENVLVELYEPLGRRRGATAELEDRME